jgi:hypothetical protein
MAVEDGSNASREGRATAVGLKAELDVLRAEIAKIEALVTSRQTEFRAAVESDRAERLMAELLRMTAELMSAQEAAARIESELATLRSLRSSRPWWWRMLAG